MARHQGPGDDVDGTFHALRVGAIEDTRALLGRIAERFGSGVLLWRGDDLTGSDVDLLAVPAAAEDLAALLSNAGLAPCPAEPGHVVWRGSGRPFDVLHGSAWPGSYPSLSGVLRRAERSDGLPPVTAAEDRLLMLAAEAVAGRPLDKVVRRARGLLEAPGVAERLVALAAEEGMQPLAALVAEPDRLRASARRGRLTYSRAAALAVRAPAARSALRARLAARAARVLGRRGPAAHRWGAPRGERPLLITFSGMDGAGKSTAVESVEHHLRARGIPVHVAWARLGSEGQILNRLALPVKRLLRREGTIADPIAAGGPATPRVQDAREVTGRRRTLSWAWIVLVAAINARSYRRSAGARRAGLSVVCDRWAIDALVDLELRYGEHRAARAILRRLPPRPDLAVLLSLDAATAAARKPDDQARRVLHEMERLYAVRGHEDETVVVDAGAPRERVRAQVLELVDRAIAERR